MEDNEILELILETTREYIASMTGDVPEVGPESRLFGPAGVVDSLGLVAVLVEIEQRLNEKSTATVSLMDERAMSQTRSPFRTPRSLSEYVSTLLRAPERPPDGT